MSPRRTVFAAVALAAFVLAGCQDMPTQTSPLGMSAHSEALTGLVSWWRTCMFVAGIHLKNPKIDSRLKMSGMTRKIKRGRFLF